VALHDITILTRPTGQNPQIQFSGSAYSSIALEVLESGSIAFMGDSGSLFSISDTLIGSLMSVNDISGLPILEVFDSDKVVMGSFGQNTLVVTGSLVGIGTSTPSASLHVSNGNILLDNSQYIQWKSVAGVASPVFRVNSNNDVTYKAVLGSDHIFLDSAGNELVRITDEGSTGNVGINTDNPGFKLHVYGSDNAMAKFESTDDIATIWIRDNDTGTYVGASDSTS